MSRKQRGTFDSIFEKPTRSDILWTDVESLLRALGASMSESRGSRVRIALEGVRAVFHRPHPERVTDSGAVSSLRKFLETAGFKNEKPPIR